MFMVCDCIMDYLIVWFEVIQEGVDGYNYIWNWIVCEFVLVQMMGYVDVFLFLFDSKECKWDDIGYIWCIL